MQLRNQEMCHPITVTKSKKVDLQSDVCLWFIIDHKCNVNFHRVNVIDRSQRT